MSFRRFVYFCALSGAWAALIGWALGRMVPAVDPVAQVGVKGLYLGLLIGLGLGLVDALWTLAPRQLVRATGKVGFAGLVGGLSGMIGGVVGQLLYGRSGQPVFLVLGWAATGLLIGTAPGAFDFLATVLRGDDARGARRKLRNGGVGGLAGGLLGGLLFLLIKMAWVGTAGEATSDQTWSPSAAGFVALGGCIGLAVGLAQVILMEAWVRVEIGFRAGRELVLSKPEITLGRQEACDIGLFGDADVERIHARIQLRPQGYVLTDVGTRHGTYLNGRRLDNAASLRAGDVIDVGKCRLRFGERRKRPPDDQQRDAEKRTERGDSSLHVRG